MNKTERLESQRELWNIYCGILFHLRKWAAGETIPFTYRFDCPEYGELLARYPVEKTAGKGSGFVRALRLCRELLGEFPEDSRGKRLALELESVLARTDLTELAGHLGGVLEGNRRMTRIIKSLKKSVDRPRLMRYALGQDVLELEDGSQQQDTAVTRP